MTSNALTKAAKHITSNIASVHNQQCTKDCLISLLIDQNNVVRKNDM